MLGAGAFALGGKQGGGDLLRPTLNELWKQGTKKAGKTRLSVRAEKVQSGQYKGSEQSGTF